MTQLTKQSSAADIKAYFAEVLELSRGNEDFPVNLDDVWPLVYAGKNKAVRALKSNELFMQDVDYQILTPNGQNSDACDPNTVGRPTDTYMLSVPCLEFFIARKVRAVFEVYRQVFHKVANGEQQSIFNPPLGDTNGLLAPLAMYHRLIMQRYDALVNKSNVNEEIKGIQDECQIFYIKYRLKIANLAFIESVGSIEGRTALLTELGYRSIPLSDLK